jgi:cyclin T
VRKQQIISIQVPVLRHPQPSVGGERRSTTALARSPVRKQQTISTPDFDLRHTNPSVGGVRKPTAAPAPARARSPVRKSHTHPSAGGERRSSAAPARSPVRKEQIISTPDSVLRDTNPSVGGERQPTTAPAPARAGSPERKLHTHPSAGGERRSATALARSPVRKEQIISTPDSLLSHTNPSHRGLKSNNFDRHASRHMRVDSSVHRDSTASSGRNEGSMPQRMHVDHSLNKTTKDGRPEVLTLREALRADHVYHVRSGPKDVNMARVANFVNKRKIQEAAEHPALVNKPDGDAWTGPQIRSVIVAPPSLKKQKI